MITTIIFDLSEVYLGGMYGIEEKISKISGTMLPADYLHIQKEVKDYFHGLITEDQMWDDLLDRHDWNIQKDVLKKIVREQMTEIEGTREVIEELHKKGYKLGLLSIHGREWVDHVEKKFDYHKFFHSRLYSFEIGLSKPDPRAFEMILEKLGAKAEECLFIDDYDVNTRAAQTLGIQAIIFENAQQLKKDLTILNIL